VADACTIVIAASDALPTLKARTAAVNGEVLTFSDGEALRALEAIMHRRPQVVTIERMFASTPRGVALINRIKADPSLVDIEIQVVSHDTDYARVLRQGAPQPPRAEAPHAAAAPTATPPPAKGKARPPTPGSTGSSSKAAAAASPAKAPPHAPLDRRGTRRAERVRFEPPLDIMVDGSSAALIDLSTIGAQVIASAAVKPNQRVRLALNDDRGTVRLAGSVAWASFEITKGGPRYRAGIEFVKPDQAAIEAFCERHGKA
jgi:hypothetical protein